MACITDTNTVRTFMRRLREAGCAVEEDYKSSLAVKATDADGTVVYWGLQKCRGGPWLVGYKDNDRIKWTKPPSAVKTVVISESMNGLAGAGADTAPNAP